MTSNYILATDASADLVPDFVEKEEVHVIPMTYMLDDEEYVCSGMESAVVLKWYYDAERSGKMTHTSQISLQSYINFFRSFAEKGQSVLYLSLSGGLSGTYDSSRLAAEKVMEEFPDVRISCVDSRSTSGGIQLLLEKVAKNRSEGISLEGNTEWAEKNRLNICHWFMVEDLMYLKRNGRISPTTAFVGSMLNIKPILRIENDGTLVNFTKKHGTRATLNQLLTFYNNASEKAEGERVYVVHSDNEQGADYLEQGVKNINPSCVLTRTVLSPIIGCHTGPGLCAIIHFGKRIQ